MEGIRNKELKDYIEQNNVSCARIDGVFLIGIKDVDIIIDRVKNSVVLADVSKPFYCKADSIARLDPCKEQCKHCK